MNDIRRIEDFFSPEDIIAICEDEFRPLADKIAFNMMTKTRNGGADVNSLGLPEEATGETARSLNTISEEGNGALTVSFVGREGIAGIDEGQSPQDVQQQYGSFQSFLQNIERWARAKETRWLLEPGSIDAWRVASNVWDHGTVLYQEGGGTEIMKDLLPEAVQRVDSRITDMLDNSIYNILSKKIETL